MVGTSAGCCAHRKRPHSRAAEQRHELAALYSIEMHLLPQLGNGQHTALASIKSGPRCTARFRPCLPPLWVKSPHYRAAALLRPQ
jgi:hypothetical protein